ncbi:MAG: DUF2271 domain-containing protein [Aliiglaciecola sp.]|uniref:DUF2271 domain-containing protein n=1 Tax=Aliiglaciecola sp. TaxID=1872441 RepID=UPI0032986607
MDITIYGADRTQVNRALDELVNNIQALEGKLSTWLEDSEINQLNQTLVISQRSNELTDVLQLCEQWHNQSEGKFSCRMGGIRQRWVEAENTQKLLDRVEMRYLARAIQKRENPISFHMDKVHLASDIQLDPAGLAKGYIIDTGMGILRKLLPSATGIKLDIGGDISFYGVPDKQHHWKVGLGNYADNLVNRYIEISHHAVASSGHQSRFYEIERRKFSHILDPDQGWPMDSAPSAIVIAKNATTADAVATALSTQSASKGIEWVNKLQGVEALVRSEGIVVTSGGWHQFVPTPWQEDNQAKESLNIEYQIPSFDTAKYHRPYLALWISDSNNNTLRQLLLLGESERWAKENNRWWRRVGRKLPGLLDAVARPTRLPGKYHLSWDGLNNQGESVKPGEFILHVEAAREGGGHDYQKIHFDTRDMQKPIQLPAKGELGQINISQSIGT